MSAAVATVISKNYLAFARTLCASVRRQHPQLPFFVCLVDEPGGEVAWEDEPFSLLLARELFSPEVWRELSFRYNVLELNTAIKPFFFAEVLKRGFEKLLYFDPDIVVCSPLEGLFSALDDVSILLTPHLIEPLPDDGRLPDELHILRAGAYNLGFLGMRHSVETARFLHWWGARLRRWGASEPQSGLFTDQRWVDLVPCLFSGVRLHRDPGCNIAYWNLHERGSRLGWDGERVTLDAEPATFFHFSGFDPEDIERVSRHQNRFTLERLPALRPAFESYREELLRHGWREQRAWRYSYDRFESGEKIPDLVRWLWRHENEVHRFGDPFGAGPESFLAWLREPVGRAGESAPLHGIPRLWREVYLSRPDMIVSLGDIFGPDRDHFFRWIREASSSHPELVALSCPEAGDTPRRLDVATERFATLEDSTRNLRRLAGAGR